MARPGPQTKTDTGNGQAKEEEGRNAVSSWCLEEESLLFVAHQSPSPIHSQPLATNILTVSPAASTIYAQPGQDRPFLCRYQPTTLALGAYSQRGSTDGDTGAPILKGTVTCTCCTTTNCNCTWDRLVLVERRDNLSLADAAKMDKDCAQTIQQSYF